MKKIKLFILRSCPYCKEALKFLNELTEENPEYKKIEIEITDESENRAYADSFDYYYVPTLYVENKKLHEGASTKKKIKAVLDAAL